MMVLKLTIQGISLYGEQAVNRCKALWSVILAQYEYVSIVQYY